ncbi:MULTISPECIES: DinB family protein [Myroides]|uniref:DinB family protein n=1 Tax=Myroides odoratus TaxID=256 RepID=UPI0024C0A563|nr:DinB family protein [Myroides sp. mNGS23_01]WHT38181.1 DinB family protein [Myroides sp. mNGS23_01]
MNTVIISKEQLLQHWQGQRSLTRRVIEAFPEHDLFNFSIGGMRPFSMMCAELIAIAVPSLASITSNQITKFDEKPNFTSKAELLKQWDEDTIQINTLFPLLTEAQFQNNFVLFGEYDLKIQQHIFYFIDNEIHHRGQAYVYLRALGIEPPYFWETF